MKFIVHIWLLFLMLIPTFVAADTPHTCGSVSLYNFAQILGIEVKLEETDDALKQKSQKRLVNNFAELVASAKDIGIELQGVKLTYKQLHKFDTPIIAHLKTTFEDDNPSESSSAIGHFIVVEHATEKWVRIFDTPKDSLYGSASVISKDRFMELWTGRSLVLSDDQRQQRHPNVHTSPLIIDFGKAKNREYKLPIQLENRSNTTIKIIEVVANCNCTVIERDANVILPGEKTTFKINWDVNALNRSLFTTIHIKTDAQQRPNTFISLGVIREFSLIFIPETVSLKNSIRTNTKRVVELQNLSETSVKIEKIEGSQEWINPSLRSNTVIFPWRTADIVINFETKQMPIAKFDEKVTVQYVDGNGKTKILTLPISGKVEHTYTLTPNRFFFGRINAAEEITKTLVFKNLGSTPVHITKIETDIGTAHVKTLEIGKRYQVQMILPPTISNGILKGKVRIHTNLPEFSIVQVPFFAVVAK